MASGSIYFLGRERGVEGVALAAISERRMATLGVESERSLKCVAVELGLERSGRGIGSERPNEGEQSEDGRAAWRRDFRVMLG